MTQAVAIPGSLSQAGGGPGSEDCFRLQMPGWKQGVKRLGDGAQTQCLAISWGCGGGAGGSSMPAPLKRGREEKQAA